MKTQLLNFLGIALLTISVVQCLMIYFLGTNLKLEMYFFKENYVFPLVWINIFVCLFGIYVVYFVKVFQMDFSADFVNYTLIFLNIGLVVTAYLVFQDVNQASDQGWAIFPPFSAMSEEQVAQFHMLTDWFYWKNIVRKTAFYAQFVAIGSLVYVVFQLITRWKVFS